ncbi:MAG: ATP-binding protein [Thermofilaceae archaeon]
MSNPSTGSLKPCNLVVVETPTGGVALGGAWRSTVASTGARLFGGTVVLCRPDPCFITRYTRVVPVKRTRYTVERLQHNVVVTVEHGKSVERLVYPVRVWETVESVLRRFFTSRPPQQGFLFYGPPGTGKTSLAELIARMHGLTVVRITPTSVLSKWVGESERNLYALLKEGEALEPSVVLVDDCEWLFRSRELKASSATGQIELTLTNILLDAIEDYFVNEKKVLVLATTNAPLELIDPALLRSGRLGKPIHIPLPDYEAVYEFLVREGIDQERARRWAYYAVNMGLGMADVKHDLLQQLREGVEPVVEPKREPGYARYFFVSPREYEREVIEYLRSLDPYGDFSETVKERSRRYKRTSLWFAGPENVAVALANAFVTYYGRMPSVTLLSARYALDAVDAANTLGGFLIVPWSIVRYGHIDATSLFASLNLAFAGPDAVNAVRVSPVPERGAVAVDKALRAITVIVLEFYGARCTREAVEKLVTRARSMDVHRYLELLNKLGYYGSRPEHLELYY